eukprot:m.202337 g.202337  ORF g.202337 m.202337 type:complete len:1177 (+) comp17717_c0_seq1:107-3637(+)
MSSAKRRWMSVGTDVKRQLSVDAKLQEMSADAEAFDVALMTESADVKACVEQACSELPNTKLEVIELRDLKAYKTSTVSTFNEADFLIVDETDTASRAFLSFQLGMRESVSDKEQKPILIIYRETSPDEAMSRAPSNMYMCKQYSFQKGGLAVPLEDERVPLKEFLKELIKSAGEGRKKLNTREAKLEESLKRASSLDLPHAERLKALTDVEAMLKKNPDLMSDGRLVSVLLTYRDLSCWNDIIRIATDMEKVTDSSRLPVMQYLLAFALNRRNLPRDRDRAVSICEVVCKSSNPQVAEDAWGLKGRTFKDRFIESIEQGGVKDFDSCEAAIVAYREAFKRNKSLYGGVNLLTLLFASEEYEERLEEIETICMQLNSDIARSGGTRVMSNYWQAASMFEVNVVGGSFDLAIQAAETMYELATETWMIESTMRNIQLIDRLRKHRESLAVGTTVDDVVAKGKQDHLRIAFEFWSEFFLFAAKSQLPYVRFPVLFQITGKPRPGHVTVHPATETDESCVEFVDLVPTEHVRKYPVSMIARIKEIDIPFVRDASHVDKRRISVILAGQKGSAVHILHFSSALQRTKFVELCRSGGYHESQEAQERNVPLFEWEYEEVNGQRKVLGRGATATVYAGIRKDVNMDIAIKEVETLDGAEPPVDLLEEINTIRHLQHKNIIKFFQFQRAQGSVQLVMECVPGGSLTSLLYKFGPLVTAVEHLVDYSGQILSALNYLHSMDIIHRDVKGDNVLVNKDTGVLKLADFGTSKRMAGLNPRTDTLAGTPWYMAPEVIISNTRDYGRESDIWSYGCTIWQIAMGRPPLVKIRDADEVMNLVGFNREHEVIPENWPSDLRDLLQQCWMIEPSQRATSEKLMSHSLFNTPAINALRRFSRRGSFIGNPNFEAQRTATIDGKPPSIDALSRRREVAERLYTICSDASDTIIEAWRDQLRKSAGFTPEMEQDLATIPEQFEIMLDLMRKDKSHLTTEPGLETRIKKLIPETERVVALQEGKENMLCAKVKHQLDVFKTAFSPEHFIVQAIRTHAQPPPPHWIFDMETICNNVADALLHKLQDSVTRKGPKSSDLLMKMRKRGSSTSLASQKDTTDSLPPVTPLETHLQVDEQLVAFLSKLGLGDDIMQTFAHERVTFEILRDNMEKDDLKDLKLPVGPRCLIWSEIEKLRKA